jgi:hypothetical protein
VKTFVILSALLFSFCDALGAANPGTLIQVTRRLRMSFNDPVPPKDFFIDLGTRNGVKVGDVFEVSRHLPVNNALSGSPWHLMRIVLGEIRIYAVGESTAVGRAEIEREPSSLPAMDYSVFMVGDEVQLKTNLPLP